MTMPTTLQALTRIIYTIGGAALYEYLGEHILRNRTAILTQDLPKYAAAVP